VQVVLSDSAWGVSSLLSAGIVGSVCKRYREQPVAYPCTASLRGRLTSRAIELESKSAERRWQVQVDACAPSSKS
jgi:hypothetical protein